ncbi:hypothetical protein PTKIN_Ptkin05aG0156800 [Pterospermum kingtungense]
MKKNGGLGQSTSKPDRKTIEKNRRIHMKNLCFELASLMAHHNFKPSKSKEILSQQDQLDLAAAYIKQLKERVEKLKEMKEQVMKSMEASSSSGAINTIASVGLTLPVVELKDLGSSIEVILITGLNKNFMFYEIISILEQEGGEVLSASFSTVGGKIFHTLHAQVIE